MEDQIPKIRFKGAYDENGKWVEFTHPWEQRKLSDTLVSLQNNTLSRADLSNETGVAKNVHYGDVLIKFGEVLDVSKVQLPTISDESVLTKYKASFLQNGDVIVADTAEDTTVGKCSEIAGLNNEIVLSGLHTIPYRPVEKFASGYLGYYLNSSAYHNQLIPLMQGIKVTSISKSAMQDTNISYPKSVEEQGKIGAYFRSLDHLITLHQRKCDLYQQAKQSMMEKLYSFNSDWEEKQLGEILYEYNEKCEKNGRYEHVSLTKDGVIPKSDRYNRDFLVTHEDKKYRITHLNDICYNPANLKFGVICRNKYGDGIFSPIYITFKVKDFCDPVFIEYLVTRNDFIQQALQYQQGTVYERMSVMPVDLLSMKVFVPNIEEQIKIANILSKYDELIAISKNQLNTLQTLKKGLLQQMFV